MAKACPNFLEVRSPTGVRILGTMETIEGVALATVTYNRTGKLNVQFVGETSVDWNSQVTQSDGKGGRLFVDEDGSVWSETQLQRKPTT